MKIFKAFAALFGLGIQSSDTKGIYPEENLSRFQAVLDDKPALGCVNLAYKDFRRQLAYPWCLKITIGLDLDKITDEGLPEPDESIVVGQFESDLLREIRAITPAHYIGYVISDTFWETYIYLDYPEKVSTYLTDEIDSRERIRSFAFIITQDYNWSMVSELWG